MFVLRMDDDSERVLWFPCESRQQYEILCYDLSQSIYWKVSYVPELKKIMRMEQLSFAWCSIQ